MSSDDDSDFLSSSDGLSDDGQTTQNPPGGAGTQPAKTTPTSPAAKATTSPAASASRPRQSHGNLLTDLMEYVTFAHYDTTPPAKIVNQKSIGRSRSPPGEIEEETTPLCRQDLDALEDGFTETPPPDYGSLTPSAPIVTAPRYHDEEEPNSTRCSHRTCRHRRCAACDGHDETTCPEQCSGIFRMLFMVCILLGILLAALNIFRIPRCGHDMYGGFGKSRWWCFNY